LHCHHAAITPPPRCHAATATATAITPSLHRKNSHDDKDVLSVDARIRGLLDGRVATGQQ
jgi:hypothetical protein